VKDTYDVVVIGSGFGGAVTACRLAQAGHSVCILEKGGWWDKTAFPRSAGELADRMLWRGERSTGLIEYRSLGSMSVVQGAGVGGGSLPYFNVHLRPAREVFQHERWPSKLSRKGLDPYYDLGQDMLGARPLCPPDGYELPTRTKAFLDAAARAGATHKPDLVDLAVHTGPPHRNPHGGGLQQPCEYCGNCLLGCHVNAKNTLDLTYLSVARRHQAEIFAHHEVTSIVPIAEEQYEVHFVRTEPPGEPDEPGVVVGRTVVLAAGALGTIERLLRCRDVHESLPHNPDVLGVGFSGNGCLLFAGAWETPERIHPGRGPSVTAVADFSTHQHRITIQDLGFPEPFLWFFRGRQGPFGRSSG
jgi:cholesterol oxidase